MRLLKPVVFLISFMFLLSAAHAQDSTIVKWSTAAKKTGEGSYEITFTGKIKKGWHVYTAADAETEISGITTTPDDSSFTFKPVNLLTKGVDFTDPVFSKKLQVSFDSIVFTQAISIAGDAIPKFKVGVNYEVANAQEFYPESPQVEVITDAAAASKNIASNRILIPSINIDKPLTECKTSSTTSTQTNGKSKGLISLFLLGFVGGLVALLTPCVFPMIPLTVSFFTKKAERRRTGVANAFLYGFFIFLIYILLSVPFHFIDKLKPEILNNISTNAYLNVGFFVIFIFFALSFFGFYELTLPSSISNRADSKAGAKNTIGIFFMALTLAIVSFSCTGPILGSLLAGSLSADGGAMQLTAGMGGFGLALALPFALFALFPNMLNSLPKSGGWLNTVKVVLGFLEIGFAFKFFSNADLVMHWGLLKREVFIGVWIVVGLLLSLYLFGFVRFKHDSPKQKLSAFRIALAVIAGAFTLYLVPGLTNTKYANLKLISGFPPPLYYSVYADKSDCILNLNCSRDYEEGLKMAKEQNKLILLDFTGYACVNCRRMEENVWSNPEVHALMKEKYIVISLYVDDKKPLPAAQRFTFKNKAGAEQEIRSVGDKWAAFETENFRNNAQPLYAILNTDEVLLSHPSGYTPSAKDYLQWLQCGVDTFEKK